MPKRKVVQINLNVVKPLIKKKCRSNVVFCEMMGRESQPTWVTDWGRKPKPKNLPSPEEAARMCAILQVEPEEILTDEKDIALVRGMIEEEKAKQMPANGGEHEDAWLKAAFFEGADPNLTKEEIDDLWADAKEYMLFKIQQRKMSRDGN